MTTKININIGTGNLKKIRSSLIHDFKIISANDIHD